MDIKTNRMELSRQDAEMAMRAIKDTLDAHAFFQNIKHETFEHSFRWQGRASLSTIRVHLFTREGLTIVVFEDLGKGTSVTNASEQLATEVARLKKINPDPSKTVWLECYPYYGGDWDIDQVTYSFAIRGMSEFSEPNWKPMKNEIVIKYLKDKIKPQ